MTAEEIRERLQKNQQAEEKLAALLVEDAFATPIRELLDPLETAKIVAAGLRAWLASEQGERLLVSWGEKGREWARRQQMTVGELTGKAIEDACLDLAALPYSLDREVLIFLLDREPIRLLFRELLHEILLTFGSKLRRPVESNPLARGLGGIGRMAKERARATTLGALASGVAERVSDEVEKQLERRALEVADGALEGLVHRLADLLSHPGRREQQAALREAIVEGVFALSAGAIADEMERNDPLERARIIRRGLGLWVSTEEAVAMIRDVLGGLLADAGDQTLGDTLEDLGLLEVYRDFAMERVRRRLGPFLQGEAFAAWLAEALSD